MAKPAVMLIILDGWGYSEKTEGNTLKLARLPFFEQLKKTYPNTLIHASGEEVGLPAGQIGNSEVGHLNLGAGRVVYQELTRIFKAIRDGDFQKNPVLLEAIDGARDRGKALHLMGLLSDGGVHSHIEHLFALMELAKERGVEKLYLHAFLDGRDVPPANALEYIKATDQKIRELGLGAIATVSGRFFAMDRDKHWEDRVIKAYRAIALGDGPRSTFAQSAIEASYHQRVTDEFVEPTVMVDAAGNPVGTVEDGDSMIFFNFRADRARELTRAFVDKDFTGFKRPEGFPKPGMFVCMTMYDATIDAPVAFPPQDLQNTLGEVLAESGKTQLRIAETEKYAHVTFFFNGGVEKPNDGEQRVLVPSPRVDTYNQKPEMSASEVTQKVLAAIDGGTFDVIILNYANPDMVGHTGVLDAAIQAVEAVDHNLSIVVPKVLAKGGVILLTADHGNVEQMIDPETGGPQTAHTNYPVPFILIDEGKKDIQLREGGALQDIAPTILELLQIKQPREMTGRSFLQS